MLTKKYSTRPLINTHGNGIVTTRAYQNDNLTQSITTTGVSNFANGANGLDFTNDYDENKNKLQETISGPMNGYGFITTTHTYDANR